LQCPEQGQRTPVERCDARQRMYFSEILKEERSISVWPKEVVDDGIFFVFEIGTSDNDKK
jgi:hypothetical protein